MGNRHIGQQPRSRGVQCSTDQEGDTFPSRGTVPPWQETLVSSVCHSGFSGFCDSMLELLASGMSVSQTVKNQEASVPMVVVIAKFRSPGWHQAHSNSGSYWNLCLFHSWPH